VNAQPARTQTQNRMVHARAAMTRGFYEVNVKVY
jgi:hypothetical protein